MKNMHALTKELYVSLKNTDKGNGHQLIAIDLGFAKVKSKSCGMAWHNSNKEVFMTQLDFGDLINKISIVTSSSNAPVILVIEAPLSILFKSGCPSFRGIFEEPRQKYNSKGEEYWKAFGWYHGTGAPVTLGAMKLVELIGALEKPENILLAEAFLSDKSGKTKHCKDAEQILTGFWSATIVDTYKGLEAHKPITNGVPVVLTFKSSPNSNLENNR